MRFIFFLILISIVYFFVRRIFKVLFSYQREKKFDAETKKKHVNINKEDIIEAEFEEIEEKEKTE